LSDQKIKYLAWQIRTLGLKLGQHRASDPGKEKANKRDPAEGQHLGVSGRAAAS